MICWGEGIHVFRLAVGSLIPPKVILDFARRQGAEQAWGKTCALTKKHDGFVTQMWLLESHRSVKWEDISMTVYLPNMSNYSAHHAHEQVI